MLFFWCYEGLNFWETKLETGKLLPSLRNKNNILNPICDLPIEVGFGTFEILSSYWARSWATFSLMYWLFYNLHAHAVPYLQKPKTPHNSLQHKINKQIKKKNVFLTNLDSLLYFIPPLSVPSGDTNVSFPWTVCYSKCVRLHIREFNTYRETLNFHTDGKILFVDNCLQCFKHFDQDWTGMLTKAQIWRNSVFQPSVNLDYLFFLNTFDNFNLHFTHPCFNQPKLGFAMGFLKPCLTISNLKSDVLQLEKQVAFVNCMF